ncbi:hypothetical protein BLL42_06930 [Pseudomonas frederiksbergensis]|uniref:Uncharacterized protein n=1 Tax=Pseudomonas frederiksbergensis TaxID=104087 RepID=A0A1J0EHV7_9PSED|nr:hypothetical protein BLL42_06930 [Pseudomonas frederiksbergensis]
MGYFLKSMRWQDYPLAGDEQKSDFFEVYPPMVLIIGRIAVVVGRYGGRRNDGAILFVLSFL